MKPSWDDKALIELEFKNFERKTLSLSRPLEENLHTYYNFVKSYPSLYIPDNDIKFKPEASYDYTEIKDEEVIKFKFRLDMNKACQFENLRLILSDQQASTFKSENSIEYLYLWIDLSQECQRH